MGRGIKLIILSFTCISLFFQTRPSPSPKSSILQFRSCSSFKIALFADLHFGENAWTDWGPIQDINSIQVMSTLLHHETPDFVVYLGDVITANNIPKANASLYWDLAISPTKARGIPWASVFGNHDDAPFSWPIKWFSATGIPHLHCLAGNKSCSGDFKSTSRLKLMKHEVEKKFLSHSRSGPRNLRPSISNYYLQVSSSDDPKSPVMYLYFLDSGGGSYPEVISSAQVDWFRRKSEELNPDSRFPEIVFWHIPSQAYKSVAPFFIHKPCVGSINKEKVAAQDAEFGIMKLLVERPSVKAVFVGHNHGLDWCCPYKKKLWLCFARHTGYGGYGDWARGARILEITQYPFSLKSWIRMEDGDDWEHEEIFTDDDEAVTNDPFDREDFAQEVPAPPEIKQDLESLLDLVCLQLPKDLRNEAVQ